MLRWFHTSLLFIRADFYIVDASWVWHRSSTLFAYACICVAFPVEGDSQASTQIVLNIESMDWKQVRFNNWFEGPGGFKTSGESYEYPTLMTCQNDSMVPSDAANKDKTRLHEWTQFQFEQSRVFTAFASLWVFWIALTHTAKPSTHPRSHLRNASRI